MTRDTNQLFDEVIGNIHAGCLPKRDFELALDLISEGLDYYQTDAEHRNIYSRLITQLKSRQQMGGMYGGGGSEDWLEGGLIEHMLNHGFNPLLAAEPDQERMLNTNNFAYTILQNRLAMMETKGCGLRDQTGGNLYHSLAHYACEEMFYWLCRLEAHRQKQDPKFAGLVQGACGWVKAANSLGQTPMHVLWSEETLKESGREGRRARRLRAPSLEHCAAMATWMLWALGADYGVADQQGLRPGDLIKKRNPVGLSGSGKDMIEVIQVMTEQWDLEASTAGAQRRSKTRVRL